MSEERFIDPANLFHLKQGVPPGNERLRT